MYNFRTTSEFKIEDMMQLAQDGYTWNMRKPYPIITHLRLHHDTNKRIEKYKRIQRFWRHCLWKKKQAARLALALGLHSRLGRDCWLSQMPLDVAARICFY
jgi:hypothetical protein